MSNSERVTSVTTALMVPPMSKEKPPRDDKPVKVDRQLLVKAQLIAKVRGIPVAEYVSELLRPHIEKDFPKAIGSLDHKQNDRS